MHLRRNAQLRMRAGAGAFSSPVSPIPISVPADLGGTGFAPVETYDPGCLAQMAVVGDLNGDGVPDLVVADWYEACTGIFGPGKVSVLLGNGDGTFRPAVGYPSGGFQALAVAVADLNADGHLDVVVANDCEGTSDGNCANGGSGQVGVLLGNGDGTLKPVVSYFSGGAIASGIGVADFNGDGKPDLAAMNFCQPLVLGCSGNGSVGILLGKGDGTFLPATSYPAGFSPISEAIADLNNDGRPDVVVVGQRPLPSNNESQVSVLLGNGDGTLKTDVPYDSAGYEANWVAIGDLNADRKPDLVVGNYCKEPTIEGCATGHLAVLLGNGDGSFQSPVDYPAAGVDALSVAIADLNGDGSPDLAVTTAGPIGSNFSGPGQVGVHLNNGDGTFRNGVNFPSGGQDPRSVAVADLNGDGKPDLIADNLCDLSSDCAGRTSGSVGILLNISNVQEETTTSVRSSILQSTYGQPVTFIARVVSNSGIPSGDVVFLDGSSAIGRATLLNGKATITTNSLFAGSHSIRAAFQGSIGFLSSTSGMLQQAVNKVITTTTVTSSKNPSLPGKSVTYTATVTGRHGGLTTGSITFRDHGVAFAVVRLSAQQASFRTSYASIGTHFITAAYSGDANNLAGTSSTLTQIVKYPTTTMITTSGSPSILGQPVTFTAKVTSAFGTIPDGGIVMFYNNGALLGTSSLTGSTATFTVSTLRVNTHVIKATYVGSPKFNTSSGTVTQVVVSAIAGSTQSVAAGRRD